MKTCPDFPFRIITSEERDKLFNDLKYLKIEEPLKLTNRYNKISDYYFQKYRFQTKKGKSSIFEIWQSDHNKILNMVSKYQKEIRISDILRYLKLQYGCVNQFRPDIAVYIYQKFKPKSILDFSAGWGDRCIAAISQNIKYTGIDTNTDLIEPYKNMIDDFNANDLVKIIFDKSESVINELDDQFDLIFTSPPYYNIEKYKNMPDYKSYDDFIDTFFIPVVNSAWKKLTIGGHMALHITDSMYNSLITKTEFGPANKIFIPIHVRPKSKNKKFDIIYYWTKNQF